MPRFKWEWNINTIVNTIVQLIGLAVMLVTGGILYADLKNEDKANRLEISRHDSRLAIIEGEVRKIDRHDIRLTSVEQQAITSAEAMKTVEQTLSVLSSDIRVVREILQRIEANGRAK